LLVLADTGDVEQPAVDRARTFVVQFGVGDGGAVDLGLEQGQMHGVGSFPADSNAICRSAASRVRVHPGPCSRNSRLSISRVRPRRAATSATSDAPGAAGPGSGTPSPGSRTTT